MRQENYPVRTRTKPRGRLMRLLTVPAAVLAVAASAAAAQSPSQPQSLAAAPVTAARHTPAPQARQVTLPGSSSPTTTVTLPTGDQVRLIATGSGHYRATAVPVPGSPAVAITTLADPHGMRSMLAVPITAGKLITAGLVDQHLFDVRWLASHGDTGASGTLPVTLEYTGTRPGALPGATVVAATADTISVKVRADHAARFWAAIAGQQRLGPATLAFAAKPRLAAGINRVWPTGDATKAQASPAGLPLYNVTENITFTRSVVNGKSTLGIGQPLAIGVSGSAEGQAFRATGTSCVDAACTTVQVTYSLPTGVYMLDDLSASFWAADHEQELDIAVPQLTVAGPTTVNVDADKVGHIEVATPRPAEIYGGVLNAVRTDVDNVSLYSNLFAFYGGNSVWVLPTDPVTLGRYHVTNLWQLGPPPITMTVTAPRHLALHVSYPDYTNVIQLFTRFSGTQNLQVAYAGLGTAQDFAGQDVRGKLVIIRASAADWGNTREQLENARQAGAAGVLGVPAPAPSNGREYMPIPPAWFGDGSPAPALSYAEIKASDANTLISLLQQGKVRVSLTDTGPNYLYNIAFNWESRIPATTRIAVTSDQLEQIDSAYQAPRPGVLALDGSVGHLGDSSISGFFQDVFPAPNTFHQFYGPKDPSMVWWRAATNPDWPAGQVSTWDVLDQAQGSPDTFFDRSSVPGAPSLSEDVMQAQPGVIDRGGFEDYCSFCRQGDTFFPQFSLASGQGPRVIDGIYQAADPAQMHLYLDGSEISQDTLNGLITYKMPAEQGQYRLTFAEGNLDSSWTFSSAHPQAQDVADGYRCIGTVFGSTAACAAVPMLMLRYNAFTDVDDAVTAGGRHVVEVTSVSQATGKPTEIASLKFWTSTDGGTIWQQATVSRGSNGSLQVAYSIPKLSATSGTLSIRAQAADSAGDTIDQTYYDDYTLIAGH
jgi:hypothetical protein